MMPNNLPPILLAPFSFLGIGKFMMPEGEQTSNKEKGEKAFSFSLIYASGSGPFNPPWGKPRALRYNYNEHMARKKEKQ